jgi:D-alanine-D-alanine ligase-like ATP-grasp enzyme
MPQADRQLVLIYEPEAACRKRLLAEGHAHPHTLEISSYLAQSTDLASEFDAIADACDRRRLSFRPVVLDEAPAFLAQADPARSLVWTLTDGIAYFRGGTAPALARLHGLRTVGSDDSLFALCQDKFRSGAVLRALGLPAPEAGLARNGQWIVPAPSSSTGYFVKPNRLGAKIGIWEDSRCSTPQESMELSRRIFASYRDDAIVQPYVAGENVRASFLAVASEAGADALGVFFVESGADFQTMVDSMALYGATGADAKAGGLYVEPKLRLVSTTQPSSDRSIRRIAEILMRGLGLRDVFSFDLRVETDGTVHLIELEVCPGLPCFDFRAYCRSQWSLDLPEAMADTAANRFPATS